MRDNLCASMYFDTAISIIARLTLIIILTSVFDRPEQES